jgi:hypothetical protein
MEVALRNSPDAHDARGKIARCMTKVLAPSRPNCAGARAMCQSNARRGAAVLACDRGAPPETESCVSSALLFRGVTAQINALMGVI